jgi:gamma-glutamyltranspeptidase/glutathione hydrolase
MASSVMRLWLLPLVCACVAGCTTPPQALHYTPPQPEAASAITAKPGWATATYAVAAANPLATDAGRQVLQAGGSAVDAAIAVQMVLTLVEPQSSGIGGGAFLLHFDGKRTQAFDGRETAPAGATPNLFLGTDGKPMKFIDAVVGGRAVGVPGTVSMLALAHQQHGKLPWAELFKPAIALATQGFHVSPRLASLLANEQALRKDPVAAAYFLDANGAPWKEGHLLRNPELAAVLQRIANRGPSALMMGDVAQAMVDKVRKHPSNAGTLSLEDLAGYAPEVREPLCFGYTVAAQQRDYRICGMPPPSSGALAIGQILGMLQHTPASQSPLENAVPSADWLHLYTEAARLAFADRAQYVADPAFVQPPANRWTSLLDPDYLAARAQRISVEPNGKSMKMAQPGTPGGTRVAYAPMPDQPEYGTSHISIVDAYGNALAMTTTIEDGWGARQMVNQGVGLVGGFLLNNELTDFSFEPTDASGKPIANRVEPGKRPRSSMSPTLVFDQPSGQLHMSAGSPGGAFIIHFTAKALYAMLQWGLNAQQAIDLPNFGSLNGPTLLEEKRFSPATIDALKARDHIVVEVPLPSGLQAIERTAKGFFGGADPRREGIVLGD